MRIKVLRTAKGLTQQQLADEIGVTRSAVAMWESVGRNPPSKILPALATALGCSIDQLYGPETAAHS